MSMHATKSEATEQPSTQPATTQTTTTPTETPTVVLAIRHETTEWVQGEDFDATLPVEQAFARIQSLPSMSGILAGWTLGKPQDVPGENGAIRRIYPTVRPLMVERTKGARLPWGLIPTRDASVASFVALLTAAPAQALRLPLFLALVEQADPEHIIPGGNDVLEMGQEAEEMAGAVSRFVTRLRDRE